MTNPLQRARERAGLTVDALALRAQLATTKEALLEAQLAAAEKRGWRELSEDAEAFSVPARVGMGTGSRMHKFAFGKDIGDSGLKAGKYIMHCVLVPAPPNPDLARLIAERDAKSAEVAELEKRIGEVKRDK